MTEKRTWIRVRNWDKFQHYKDRNPPWIKNYTELLADDDYLSLTETQRSALHGIWLMYASSHGKVPDNTRSLSRHLRLRITKRTLEALSHAGFITIGASKPASTTLARRYPSRAPAHSREAETEKERPKGSLRSNGKPSHVWQEGDPPVELPDFGNLEPHTQLPRTPRVSQSKDQTSDLTNEEVPL